MLPPLTIIPAGAGSGKTFTIQEKLGQWIVKGEIAPERIVAVTFTEAAAAELRERIQSKLLGMGRLDDALKLNQAYISTIHGFGLRLLTEFAFDAGLSPKPRLLNEDEESTLTRLALAQTDKADDITSSLSHFGYKYDFNSGRSAEEVFRGVLSGFVSKLRSLGWTEESNRYVEHATSWVKNKYGETGDGEKLTARLQQAVDRLLLAYPESLAREFGSNATAKNALQSDFRHLCEAKKEGALATNWDLWKSLRSLRQSKRGSALPDDYDVLAEAVMEAADNLSKHPGPLEHEISHITGLLTAGQDVLVHYGESKREAGLVDYTHMIAMAAEILLRQKGVLETLVSRIDCLVVDEFQDTNPLQFSLLWQLKEAGVPTVIVGDMKQAIMGFQGADPILFETLIKQNTDNSDPLTQNWRSQPRLMDFVNATGPGLFGDDYVSLKPEGSESDLMPLEVVTFSNKAKKGQHKIRAAFVGERLKELLNDQTQKIIDRKTKKHRRLRGGDCAVLCPTNTMLIEYAEILRGMGLRVKLQAEGWFNSRIIQIAWYALAYVANPADKHAALYLAVTELGSLQLDEALAQLVKDELVKDPLIDKLDKLAEGAADRTIYALVTDIIFSLELFDIVSSWPDSEQARANLLKLQSEAGAFMDANREALASGGYYGSGIQSFLAWLSDKIEDDNNDDQPEPRVLDEDAIELVTWHRSKGREWPIVCVCGLDREIKAKLPKLALGYSSFDDLSLLLSNAQIEYSPTFAASETNDKFLVDLKEGAEVEARRLLYVAMTRPRDKLILEWPSYLDGNEKLTYWSILTKQGGAALQDESIDIAGNVFECFITKGEAELPDEIHLENVEDDITLSTIGRRAICRNQGLTSLTADSVTPSTMDSSKVKSKKGKIDSIQYGSGLNINSELTGAALGTYLHQCFEVLGSHPERINQISVITGIEIDTDTANKILESVESFETRVKDIFSPESIYREWPLLGIDENGSVVSGIADMIVRTEEGVWVIDHKSDKVDDVVNAFNGYQEQLNSYKYLLESAGEKVLGVGINWIKEGVITTCV